MHAEALIVKKQSFPIWNMNYNQMDDAQWTKQIRLSSTYQASSTPVPKGLKGNNASSSGVDAYPLPGYYILSIKKTSRINAYILSQHSIKE